MTWEQKLDAINGLALAQLVMSSPGNWHVSQPGVEVKAGGILGYPGGNGASPAAAVEAYWKGLTELLAGQYVVIGAYKPDRRAVRWSGYMWAEVAEGDRS